MKEIINFVVVDCSMYVSLKVLKFDDSNAVNGKGEMSGPIA